MWCVIQPPNDKTNKMACAPSEDSDQPGHPPVWSKTSLSAWRKLGSLATQWAHSEDWSDWADAQADLSLHWAHTHFVGFVMRPLNCGTPWRVNIVSSKYQEHHQQHNEPWHDKTNKMSVRPAKTQISLGIRPIWSESSLSAWRKLGSLATHWVHSEDSDQTGRMPRLIWVFAGRTVILLVLSCRGSNHDFTNKLAAVSAWISELEAALCLGGGEGVVSCQLSHHGNVPCNFGQTARLH